MMVLELDHFLAILARSMLASTVAGWWKSADSNGNRHYPVDIEQLTLRLLGATLILGHTGKLIIS